MKVVALIPATQHAVPCRNKESSYNADAIRLLWVPSLNRSPILVIIIRSIDSLRPRPGHIPLNLCKCSLLQVLHQVPADPNL